MSRVHDHWMTPPEVYNPLHDEFNFDFDPCPLHATFDGLSIPWQDRNFINPPYNRRDKPRFIQKAYDEWRKGNTCVMLIPVVTSSDVFHKIIFPHAEIRFVQGRISFIDPEYPLKRGAGRHDSMIVIFRGTA